jgi:integrase
MASVHKHSKGWSKYWYAKYRDAEGIVRFRSTKATSKRAAEKIALEWEHVEELVASGEITQAKILEHYNEVLRRVGLAEIETFSVKKWLTDWLASRRNIAESTRKRYEEAVRAFLAYLGPGENRKLEAITENDIEGFVTHLLSTGRSAGTVNKLVKNYLNIAFGKAWKLGKIKYNPIQAIDSLSHQVASKGRFTPEQVRQLVKAATDDWKGAILFAYGTGARLGDTASLTWDQIDVANGVAWLVEGKNRRKRPEPQPFGLHPDFLDWLSEQPVPQQKKDAPLFPSLAGRLTSGSEGLSIEFNTIIALAGIESPVIKAGATGRGRDVRGLSFHSLRHGAASSVFNAEGIKEIQRRVTKHSSDVLQRYTHADLDLIREAVSLIPRLPKG